MKLPVHSEINDDGMGVPMYQVRDADDNLICTSYTPDNYLKIVRAVNFYAPAREALEAAQNWCPPGSATRDMVDAVLAEEEPSDADA